MKKKILCFLLAVTMLVSFVPLSALTASVATVYSISGNISGITDSSMLSLQLFKPNSSEPYKTLGVVGNGSYSLKGIEAGEYKLSATSVGYEALIVDSIDLSGDITLDIAMEEYKYLGSVSGFSASMRSVAFDGNNFWIHWAPVNPIFTFDTNMRVEGSVNSLLYTDRSCETPLQGTNSLEIGATYYSGIHLSNKWDTVDLREFDIENCEIAMPGYIVAPLEWIPDTAFNKGGTLVFSIVPSDPHPTTAHTVTFVADDTVVATYTVGSGDKITRPADPERDGQSCSGWNIKGNGTVFSFSSHTVTSDLILYATFANTHTVNFITDEGIYLSLKKMAGYNTMTYAPEEPFMKGKVFTGWYTEDGTLYNFKNKFEADLNLYARFKSIILGDANDSGDINIKDLVRVKKLLAGSAEANSYTSDMNQDRKVNASDLAGLRNRLLLK